MQRFVPILIMLCLLIVFLLTVSNCQTQPEKQRIASEDSMSRGTPQGNQILIQDDFEKGSLDLSQWEITSDGDFAEMIVDVYDVDSSDKEDYQLRMRANTIGTSDPMKYLGIRNKVQVDFNEGKIISFDLDWNNQRNGCYLSASIYFCPIVSNNPKKEANWLAFEYTGVPPGQNVRTNIWAQVNNSLKELYADWGPHDEKGRPLGRPTGHIAHHIRIVIDEKTIQLFEDEEELYPSSPHHLKFTSAYVYIQMSSGTNYPSREVYFDNIVVRSAYLQ